MIAIISPQTPENLPFAKKHGARFVQKYILFSIGDGNNYLLRGGRDKKIMHFYSHGV